MPSGVSQVHQYERALRRWILKFEFHQRFLCATRTRDQKGSTPQGVRDTDEGNEQNARCDRASLQLTLPPLTRLRCRSEIPSPIGRNTGDL